MFHIKIKREYNQHNIPVYNVYTRGLFRWHKSNETPFKTFEDAETYTYTTYAADSVGVIIHTE